MNMDVKLMTRYEIYCALNAEKQRLSYLKQNFYNKSFMLKIKNKLKIIILKDKELKELEIKIKQSKEFIALLEQEFMLLKVEQKSSKQMPMSEIAKLVDNNREMINL